MMTKKCQEKLTCDRHITRKPLLLTLQVVKCSPTLTSFIYMRGKLAKNNWYFCSFSLLRIVLLQNEKSFDDYN